MPLPHCAPWIKQLAVLLALGSACWPAKLFSVEVELRLVAADRKDRPLVDTLVDFRNAADGGLIATHWLSGLTLNKQPVFPLVNRGPLAPGAPNGAAAEVGEKAPLKKADADDLLNDIQAETNRGKKPVFRPVDVVDPLYVGQTFSLGRAVGPQRSRASSATIDLKPGSTLQPLGITLAAGAKQIEIPCYPVTITAVIAGHEYEHAAFTPQLTCRGQDLLADLLFEHSPDLPLGDTSAVPGVVDTLQGWLDATRGGARPYRRLTLYLPAQAKDQNAADYELNGHSFRVTAEGIVLATMPAGAAPSQAAAGGGAKKTELRQLDKFSLELVLPAPAVVQKLQLPVLTALGPGWKYAGESLVTLEAGQSVLTLTLNSPAGKAVVLRPSLPDSAAAADWQLYALLSAGRTAAEGPLATVLAMPRGAATAQGKLALLVSAANAVGTQSLPEKLSLELQQAYPWSIAKQPARQVALQQTKPGQYAGNVQDVPSGGYLAAITIDKAALPAVPIALANPETAGSITLATYHNRCDYYRGEEVQAAVIVRAAQAVSLHDASLQLVHTGSGDVLNVGAVSLDSPAGETRTLFLKLPTAQLRLGEYTLSIGAEKLIAYPLRFRLYTPTPKTTFALYSWMVGSFSGPVRVGEETVANLLFDQKPTQFLRPDELARYTDQGTPSPVFRSALTADPLLPAPAKTETYDVETEQQMAVAMRLGLRFAPSYGWGLNSQEANWNPKHTLPEDLARMRRLCSLVTQRYRDFGNFAGLFLNWYPTYGGYWENHPATDGHRDQRAAQLAKETQAITEGEGATGGAAGSAKQKPPLKLGAEAELDLAVTRHKYHVGALPRAYEAWTAQASRLTPGLSDTPLTQEQITQPGLSPTRPAYPSFLPISWFDQQSYYPSTYFSTLPAATVHAYTDYGFSPFQHLWGLDFWAAGVGDKPKWVTSMSNGRDILLPQTLLAVARGADGIDLNGNDPQAARVISQLLTAHGPFFQALQPESDVAIITSLRQQIVHGKLVGRWMGYTGGTYFDLYTKLWYARRPPAVLLEEEVTPERLQAFKGVFLVNQQTDLPEPAMAALAAFAKAGGKVFKDKATGPQFPGEVYDLSPGESIGPQWEGDKYVATRDQMFVGVQAAYESSAKSLDKLLAQLPPPRVMSHSHHTLLGTLAGKQTAVVMAVNDTRTPPGIYHPWNFWSATVLAAEGELSFDKPYTIYDLMNGGEELKTEADGKGRFRLPISFDRTPGRALVLTESPVRRLLVTCDSSDSEFNIWTNLTFANDVKLEDSWPYKITLINKQGDVEEEFYRALRPGEKLKLNLPALAKEERWQLVVQDMVTGLTSETPIPPQDRKQVIEETTVASVLVPRWREVNEFVTSHIAREKASGKKVSPVVILLDQAQVRRHGEKLTALAEELAESLTKRGMETQVQTVDAIEIAEVPQRWQPTAKDKQYQAEASAGQRIIAAAPLSTRYFQGEKNRNEPDYLHPASGFGEEAARHRIRGPVILLGLPEENRFLRDLHEKVGLNPGTDWLSPGNAVVQVVHDAFTPGEAALTIQAADLAGLQAAVIQFASFGDVVEVSKETEVLAADEPESIRSATVTSHPTRSPLPRWQDEFGAPVSPIAFTPDGGLMASADLQANNYFQFDAAGKLQRKWLGKYGITPAASGETLWINPWWGAPGFLDKVICANAAAEPQWLMEAPRYSRSYQFWQHPGRATLPDKSSDDLFVAGHGKLARLSPTGEVRWVYDDTPTANDVQSFRFRRDLMLHDVSPDGDHLLVAAFGIQPYSNFVDKFIRPALLLVNARTGAVIWEKSDILINHSPCSFTGLNGDGILLGDETPGRRRLLLLSRLGQETWSLPQPAGVSEAALSADDTTVVLRAAATRNNLFQVTGEAQGLQILTVQSGSAVDLPLPAPLVSWKLLRESGTILVSTSDGRLTLFSLAGEVQWQQQFTGPPSLLVSADEQQLVIGTPDGKLRWLDLKNGATTREIDLRSYNRVQDLQQYVLDYTRSPGAVPRLNPAPALPPRIDGTGQGIVKFSQNLLAPHPLRDATAPLKYLMPIDLAATLQPGQTHVLSLKQRTIGETAPQGNLLVTITATGSKQPLLKAELPLSATWEERRIAFRADKELDRAAIRVEFVPLKVESAKHERAPQIELDAAGLFAMQFASPNVLAQRVPAAPGELPAAGVAQDSEDLADGGAKQNPPALRYNIPNDVDLTALARGAPPFQRTVEFTTPFDGKLSGQPTSWLGKPLSGSTHATLEIKLDRPLALGALALYEDPTSATGYTDTYALFGREAKTGRMVQLGSVVGNHSPFNLFVFPKTELDSITYLWLKSADGHARIAELEGYLAEEDLLEP